MAELPLRLLSRMTTRSRTWITPRCAACRPGASGRLVAELALEAVANRLAIEEVKRVIELYLSSLSKS
jgi:hypothetical protein